MTLREISTRRGAIPAPDLPELPTIEQFRGCLLGCALGDVVGAWAEAKPSHEARKFAETAVRNCDFGNTAEHHRGMPFGQYTDDTQLTRELMLSLVDEGAWVPEDFADRIARIFARDGVVGYGGATQEAATKLIDGAPWDEAGTPPPRAGNGAAMRAAPIGLFFWNDVEGLVNATHEQSIITHKAPMSVAAAVAVAAATAMCLNAGKNTSGPHEPGWWQWLARFVSKESEDYAGDIREMADMVFKGRKGADACKSGDDDERRTVAKWVLQNDDGRWSGVSPFARTSVLWSLYCLMAYPKDVWKAVELAVWVGGDSDTIAAMAGAMVGAHVGIDRFPEKALQTVVPLIQDAKTPEYDWNGLDRLIYHLYSHVVEHHNGVITEHTISALEEKGREELEKAREEGADEDTLTEMRRAQEEEIATYEIPLAQAPRYVPLDIPSRSAPAELPEPEEEPGEEAQGEDILTMFGAD